MGTLEQQLVNKIKPLIIQFRAHNKDKNSDSDVDAICAYLQQTDLSLKRKPDRNLKRAITSALDTLPKSSNNYDKESSDDDTNVPLMEVKDTNHLNRSMQKIYNQMKSQSPAPSPIPESGFASEDPSNTSPSTPDIASEQPQTPSTSRKRTKASSSGNLPEAKKTKQSSRSKWPTPSAKLSDLGGVDQIIDDILQLIAMPLKHPEIYLHLGIQPPRGILLHGPPGCGKTLIAHAIAGESNVPFLNISAPSVVSGMSGESEKKIREVFEEAKELAPCLLFIDEIDAITPKRETAQREMERRIVAQLLTCMDDLTLEKTNNKPVLIIGATNRPDSLDPALRRAGRFDREIAMGVPDEIARFKILEKLSSKLRLSGDFDLGSLSKITPGFVGADLNALTAEAGMVAVKRIFSTLSQAELNSMELDHENELPSHQSVISRFLSNQTEPLSESDLEALCITYQDFLLALKSVQPSAKREGFATVPDVSWDDIGALSEIRQELRMAIVEPIKHPEVFERVGISSPMGVLLYGPPGCGKTLLAKAVANESHCNFISVKGPELLNKYVGESERAIRQVFARAQSSKPCIVFFDELDALAPTRSNDSESQSASRLVNTLLTELDGMQSRQQVFIIAATNRPDMVDPAMLRPGRLDKTLYVDLPTPQERHEILITLARKSPLSPCVSLQEIAWDARCDGFSGADLSALVRESAIAALKETVFKGTADAEVVAADILIKKSNFDVAFKKITPSVSKRDRKRYELLRVRFGYTSEKQANGSTNNQEAPQQEQP
ncbi:hypothetical protein HK098_006230 [Nowakowskiella sp. JEL0407]|nr:hypothetical protein HK098_006230 [Nowakowskiella sp. JEL0407]